MVEQFNNALKKGEVLNGTSYRYLIEKVLGQGSFGITYLASVKMTGALGSIDANIKVAIKEFFMRDINGRSDATVTSGSKGGIYDDYKRKFTREAVNLSKLQHPNIIKVIESFEANNTVYYVMEYIGGGSLDDYITKNNGLKEDEAIKIVKQIGSALSFMHKNKMLHLDLKPSNIMRKDFGDVVLIDFGLSKQYDKNGEPESSTKVGAGTPGYAPIEQANYCEGKGFPVTMDVYALGATMFKMLTGVRPPEASDILNDGFPLYELQEHGISDSLSACIAKAMAPTKKDRYQSVSEFISSLENDEATIVDVEVKREKTSRKETHSVKEYRILPNTSRVKIEYSPMTPIESGRYIALVNPNGMSLGRFEDSTYFTYPMNEVRYKEFLSDLQNLNLSIKNERLINHNDFSEEPEKLIISLFDNDGKKYAKYWIGGWKNEFGNIIGNVHELNQTIKEITPYLQDYWSSMYARKNENISSNGKDNNKSSLNQVYRLISDSVFNPNLEYEVVGLTEIGLQKLENEDCLGWQETKNGSAIIVCDGSHTKKGAGSAASTIVTKTILDFLETTYNSPIEAISNSFEEARKNLLRKSKDEGVDLRSTCAMTLIKNNKIYWGLVGNCRIYYYTPNKGLALLTKDQSYVQSLVDKGLLTIEDARIHPEKEFGINQIGVGMLASEFSTKPIIPIKDAILLICSDGLTNMVEDNEIEKILAVKGMTLSNKIEKLKELAINKGGEDNITLSAIRFSQIKSEVNTTNVESPSISYRWIAAILALIIEVVFAWFMLTQSRESHLDSDGRILSGLYFFASLMCVYYLFGVRKKISLSKWKMATIISTIACLANSCLLPIWNGSLTGAYFLLSIGLSIVSSFTLLIKKSI